ncbi:MAG: hypothetical protein K5981_00885 [Clostridia bacterium]|nr:hypothetical protein [Clostridia bacterium]
MAAFAEDAPKATVQYLVSGAAKGTLQVTDDEGDPLTDSEGIPYPVWRAEEGTGFRYITVDVGTVLHFQYAPAGGERFLYWNHGGNSVGFETSLTVTISNSTEIDAVTDLEPGPGVGTLSCVMDDIDFGTRIQGYVTGYKTLHWSNKSTWSNGFQAYMFVGLPCFTLSGDDPDAFELNAVYGDDHIFDSRPYGNTSEYYGIQVQPKAGLAPGTYNATLNYTEIHGAAYGTASAALSFRVVESGHTVDVVMKLVGQSGSGSYYGSVTGKGDIPEGEPATLTATPASDLYEFVRWAKGEETVSTDNPYVFTPTENIKLTAEFVQVQGSLRYGTPAHSTVTVKDSGGNELGTAVNAYTTQKFPIGTELIFHCEPEEGHHFIAWNRGGAFASYEQDYHYTVGADNNTEITAIVDGEPNAVDRILSCAMDDIDFGSKLQGYAIGSGDYKIVEWSNTSVSGNQFDGWMLVARPCFTLGGADPDAFELYPESADGSFYESRAKYSPHYNLVKVRPKADLPPGTYTATLHYTDPHGESYGSCSATLSFEVRAGVGANVTISPAEGGTVDGADATHEIGDTITLTANPAEHYVFLYWQEGDARYTDNPYSYTALATRELTAVFKSQTYLVLSALPVEAGTVSGSGWYDPDAEATAAATPNEGWVFDHWSTDAIGGTNVTSTEASYSFKIKAGPTLSLAAVFRRQDAETASANIAMTNAPAAGAPAASVSAKDAADPALFTVSFTDWKDSAGDPVSSFSYGGSYKANITLQLGDGYVFSSLAVPQITGGGSVPSYQRSDDAKTITGTYVVTIPKLEPQLSDFDLPADLSRIFSGEPQTVSEPVADKDGMGAVTVKYDGKTEAPKYPGTYSVTFDVAEGSSYAAASGLVIGTLTIAQNDRMTAYHRSGLSAADAIDVTVDKDARKVSVEGSVSSSAMVLIASYDADGRFLGVELLAAAGETAAESGADSVEILWVSADGAPQCEAACEKLD